MGKFKVGDKVEIVNVKGIDFGEKHYYNGMVTKVLKIIDEDVFLLNKDGDEGVYIAKSEYDCIKLVDSKPSKKQRIETLEKEVSELKLIVHELRERKVTTVELDGKGVSAASIIGMTIEPSTGNIIEFEGAKYRKVDRKAREGDVAIVRETNGYTVETNTPYKVVMDEENELCLQDTRFALVYRDSYNRTLKTVDVYEPITEPSTTTTVEDEPKSPNQLRAEIIEKAKVFFDENGGNEFTFSPVSNERARFCWKVVSNGYGFDTLHGLSVCNPNDVFNEHIGKAIALGRALKLDVSDFVQAVQPTVAVGQRIQSLYIGENCGNPKYANTEVTGVNFIGHPEHDGIYSSYYRIINDTNAIYRG